MQALAELRYIDKQPDQLHITGIKNGTAHRRVALNHGIFPVRMTAGVPVGHILGNGSNHNGLILLILLPDGWLYQVGDFFELYGEDAKEAAAELELHLTTRPVPGAGRIEMCGIPAHQLAGVSWFSASTASASASAFSV